MGVISGYEGQRLAVDEREYRCNLRIPPHRIPINYEGGRGGKLKVEETERHPLDQVMQFNVPGVGQVSKCPLIFCTKEGQHGFCRAPTEKAV